MNTPTRKTHTLSQNDRIFLNEKRRDPVTGDSFEEGDEIVICVGCKSAFKASSWDYIGGMHCSQSQTLDFSTLSKSKPSVFNISDIGHAFRVWLAELIFSLIDTMAFMVVLFLSGCIIFPLIEGEDGLLVALILFVPLSLIYFGRDAFQISFALKTDDGIFFTFRYRSQVLKFLALFMRKFQFGLMAILFIYIALKSEQAAFLCIPLYLLITFFSLAVFKCTLTDFLLGIRPFFKGDDIPEKLLHSTKDERFRLNQ